MTNEEAIMIARGLRSDFKVSSEIMVDFCNTVIKALEQEPLSKYTISGFYFAGGVRNRFCEEVYAESHGKAVDLVIGKYAWIESLVGNSFKFDLGTLDG